ncbi:putative reverse transcriptase zinc-binding domain-containing protein [Helianthus anomalus]
MGAAVGEMLAWDRVSSPKKDGGLGLCKLKFDLALLSKWGWRFKNDSDGLWVKVVKAIHSGSSGWAFLPCNRSIRGTWLNICNIINKPYIDNKPLCSFVRGEVASGGDILFWLDPWIAETPLREMFPCLFRLEVIKNCSVRDRLEGGITWLWKNDPDLADEAQELVSLSSMVSLVVIGVGKDMWKWLGDSTGSFSVRSVKDMLNHGNINPERFVFEWCRWVPLKCNIFAWRLELNRIATYDALFSRGIVSQVGTCPMCGSDDESVIHLFISCRFASIIWYKVSRWCHIPSIFAFSIKDLLEIHKFSRLGASAKKILQGVIITVCWCIWLARNKTVFSVYRASEEEVFSDVRSLGFFWFRHRSSFRTLSWHDWCKSVIM